VYLRAGGGGKTSVGSTTAAGAHKVEGYEISPDLTLVFETVIGNVEK